MKVSYVEGVANHNGPKSCGASREGGVEALTGGRTGRVLSREIYALLRKRQVLRDADALEVVGRQHRVHRHRKVYQDPGTQTHEFVLMVKYGMLPLAAMQADLVNGAKLLGWDWQIGALESGFLADVIAVAGDPLQDIGTLQSVSLVVKGGVVYKK